jgi:hypothetical protein
VNLFMAMARVALFLDKSRNILDRPSFDLYPRTIEASQLDVEAIHACMVELVRLRKIAALVGMSEEAAG